MPEKQTNESEAGLPLLEPGKFLAEAKWLKESDYLASTEALGRVEAGLAVAETIIEESFRIAEVIASPGYQKLRERIDALRPGGVFAGEVVCIDGRMSHWMRAVARVLSSFATPAGLLEIRDNLDGQAVIGSLMLAEAIKQRQADGQQVVEFSGPHTSLLGNTDKHHPVGCGKFTAMLRSGGVTGSAAYPSQFSDGGVFLDLTQPERLIGEELLAQASVFVAARIVDTDTQGVILVGDSLKQWASRDRGEGKYLSLDGQDLREYHLQGEVLSAAGFLAEKRGEMEAIADSRSGYGTIGWNKVGDLLPNVEKTVALTEGIAGSALGREIESRIRDLYGQRPGFTEDIAREIAVHFTYNLAVMWLSGFDDPERVPERLKSHGERYAVLGDTTLGDFWVENSPFLIAGSESAEKTGEHVDTALGLLGKILTESHAVNPDEEAMVLFVCEPVDGLASPTAQLRVRVRLGERFDRTIDYLEKAGSGQERGLITEGRVVVIPVLVDEKSRAVVEVPDFSELM